MVESRVRRIISSEDEDSRSQRGLHTGVSNLFRCSGGGVLPGIKVEL